MSCSYPTHKIYNQTVWILLTLKLIRLYVQIYHTYKKINGTGLTRGIYSQFSLWLRKKGWCPMDLFQISLPLSWAIEVNVIFSFFKWDRIVRPLEWWPLNCMKHICPKLFSTCISLEGYYNCRVTIYSSSAKDLRYEPNELNTINL